MNFKKTTLIGAIVLIMASFAWAASNGKPWKDDPESVKQAYNAVRATTQAAASRAPAAPMYAEAVQAPASGKLELVEPPAELPRVNPTAAMVTSASPNVPAEALRAAQAKASANSRVQAVSATASAAKGKQAAASRVKAQASASAVQKPAHLFSYVRLLNFSPHPQQEEFLRDKPLVLNGKNYHFTVTYHEDWKVITDDNGQLQKIAFEINLFENGTLVRTLKTPAAALNAKNIRKGQVLGLAEVAPYKFKMAVDSFTLKNKAISELVFKFDLSS